MTIGTGGLHWLLSTTSCTFCFRYGCRSSPRAPPDSVLDHLRLDICKPRQRLCSLRCWIGDIGDQVHHCRICDERLSWLLDVTHQIDLSTAGHRLWPIRRERRPKCSLRRVHWQRHLTILQQIPTKCREDPRDPFCVCCCGCRCGVWESYRWGSVFPRRNVFVFSS